MISIKQQKKSSGYSYVIQYAGQTFARMDLDYRQISTLLAWFSLIYKTLAKGERADSVYRDITTLYSYIDLGTTEFQSNHGVVTIMKIIPFLSNSSLTDLMQITGITNEHQEAVYRIITPQFYEFTS